MVAEVDLAGSENAAVFWSLKRWRGRRLKFLFCPPVGSFEVKKCSQMTSVVPPSQKILPVHKLHIRGHRAAL